MILMREAGLDDCLSFAGDRATMRRYVVAMQQRGEAYLIIDAEDALALAFIIPRDDGLREFCLGISPRARVHMREMCRAAQLILKRLAQDGAIVCHVMPGNRSGARMARIVGFEPDPEDPIFWTLGAI